MAPLPEVPPPPSASFSRNECISLNEWTNDELAELAAKTIPPGLQAAAILDAPPGVPADRIAFITGRTSPGNPPPPPQLRSLARGGRGRSGSRLAPDLAALLADRPALERLAARLDDPAERMAWQDLGLLRGPVLQGSEIDLQTLWDGVRAQGGFAAATEGRRWNRIASSLGTDLSRATNGSHLVKAWYAQYLLPFERAGREEDPMGGVKEEEGAEQGEEEGEGNGEAEDLV